MTEEFAEIVNRLAKARNFPEGAYCLITVLQDEDDAVMQIKGPAEFILPGIKMAIEEILEKSRDDAARSVREYIKDILIKDEERRFQKEAG